MQVQVVEDWVDDHVRAEGARAHLAAIALHLASRRLTTQLERNRKGAGTPQGDGYARRN